MPTSETTSSQDRQTVSFIKVPATQAGQRIDNFLMTQLKGVPRSKIYRIIRKGEVRVNRKRVKPEYKIRADDELRIPPLRVAEREALPAPSESLARCLEEAILFEDVRMLALNKPAGLAVHAGTGVSLGMIEALRQMRSDDKLELAHRLDKATSGCILVAKTLQSLNFLSAAFKQRTVHKRYHALVTGKWPATLSQVDAPLARQEPRNGERKVSVSAAGKTALTRIRVLERLPGFTLIEAAPETGRTHQIRVHCQAAGHPIAGDDKYQSPAEFAASRERGVNRLCLHAAGLQLTLPEGNDLSVSAPYDESFERILQRLRQRA